MPNFISILNEYPDHTVAGDVSLLDVNLISVSQPLCVLSRLAL